MIVINNRDFNIDQNNRDYDFGHNRAALVERELEPIPAAIRQVAGYTLDKSPVHSQGQAGVLGKSLCIRDHANPSQKCPSSDLNQET